MALTILTRSIICYFLFSAVKLNSFSQEKKLRIVTGLNSSGFSMGGRFPRSDERVWTRIRTYEPRVGVLLFNRALLGGSGELSSIKTSDGTTNKKFNAIGFVTRYYFHSFKKSDSVKHFWKMKSFKRLPVYIQAVYQATNYDQVPGDIQVLDGRTKFYWRFSTGVSLKIWRFCYFDFSAGYIPIDNWTSDPKRFAYHIGIDLIL